jgi:hypothetical protein
MFLKEVKLAKAEKVLKMRAERRIEELAVTMIPYKDICYWRSHEWNFMLENAVIHTADGFYIRSKLFKLADNVPYSAEAEKAS